MANEISKTPTQAKLQVIPLSKIHDLPNVFIAKPQDKSLGSMVLSIESSGVKEPVILRQRDDGEYQLLSGYRRRRASELAMVAHTSTRVIFTPVVMLGSVDMALSYRSRK